MTEGTGSAAPEPPQRPRRRGTRLVQIAIGALLVGGLGWYLVAHRESLRHLRGIPLAMLPLLVGLRALAFSAIHSANLLCLQIFAPELAFSEYVFVVSAGIVADSLIPLGGLSSKALYLHQRHGVTPGQFFGAMGYQGSLRMVVYGLLALAGVTALALQREAVGPLHWAVATTALALGVGPLLVLGPLSRLGQRIRPLRRFSEGWQALRHAPGLTPRVAVLATVGALMTALSTALTWAAMIPLAVSFLAGATISMMVSVLAVVRVTPGNFGTAETSVGLLGRSLGVPLTHGAVVTIVSRLIGLSGVVVVLVVASVGLRLARPVSAGAAVELEQR